ncbi:hypothetical protein HDU81_010238 [Chytriomyces hyalinus]|nr:hypothetical protein HDU81_010238 [Chytriomyces hyalinus]
MINITLGIIGNYCCFKNIVYEGSYASNFSLVYDPSTVTMGGNDGWTYFPDMAVIAAVNHINESPHILPGIHVNIKRFTDCGHYDPTANLDYAGNSGGYASAVTAHDIIDVHKDVVAIVGNQYSSAAKGLNEILSINGSENEKIPVCMASTGSPRFSDRNKYQLIFRTITNHYPRSTILLLKKWNVKRAAAIYQKDDDYGTLAWKAFHKQCEANDIQLVANIGVQTNFDDAAAGWAHQSLVQTDARYITVFGQIQFIDDVLAAVTKLGTFGKKYVWIAANFADTNPRAYTYMNGLIIGETDFMQNNQDLLDNITALAQYNFGPDFPSYAHDYAVAGFFDCTMLLAMGLSQLASQSPEKLATRGFEDEMNFTLFQNLEYSGLTAPGLMTLDAFGDRQSRIAFQSFTGDYLNRTTFALSSDDYSSIVEYNYSAPAFYGGGTVPPPDGSATITTVYYSMKSLEGRVILSLGIIGTFAAIVCLLFLGRYKREKSVMSASPIDMILFCMSSVLIYISMFFNIGIPTSTTCKAHISTLTIGITMLLPPLIIKNAMLAWLFRQTHRLQKKSIDIMWNRVRLLVYGPVSAAACAFLVWACNASIRPLQLLHNDSAYFQCHVGRDNGQVPTIVLAFNVLIVLVLFVTALFTCRIENTDLNETSKIGFVVVSVIGGYCLVQILSQAPDSMTDFKVAIIVWVVNTFILFTVMGVPIMNWYQSRTRLPLKHTERSGRSSIASVQTHNAHREVTRHVVSKYNYIQLNKPPKMINITLGIISNYCTFKNLVFNGSYATNFSQIFDPAVVDMDGNSGWAYYADLAVIAAVDQVNRNQTILPGVHVNLKRFSDCGSQFDPLADLEYYGNSAGYASAVSADDIVNVHTDVIGVIGNQYSTTARGVNEILSFNKIPVCMASTGSPRYIDKNNYPYVFRTRPNFHVPSMLVLLKQWNVKRVAIIYQDDNEFGISAWHEMKKSFQKEKISVITSVGVEGDFDNAAIEYARLSLKQSDARYMIVSGHNLFISSLLRALAPKGLYGPKYVWMSYNAARTRNVPLEYQEGFVFSDADPLDAYEDLWNTTNEMAHYQFESTEDVKGMAYYNDTAEIFNGGSSIPPSDGSIDVALHVYDWSSVEGIVLATTAAFGVLESLVCVGFLVRYRRNKLVMATSPVDTTVLCLGCLILFATGFGYIGTPTAQRCRNRVLMQVSGASLILGAMLVKNGMVVWLFRQDRRREKAVIDSAWRLVRLLSSIVPIIAVSLACVWGAREKLEPVRFAQGGVLYDRCRVPTNSDAVLLDAATGLLLVMWLILVGTAYFTAKIQIQEFNETSQIILIAFAFLVPVCLVQMISQSPDALTDFKVYIVVFIFATVILVTMVGSRALDVFRSQLSSPTDVKKESGRLRRSSKATVEVARPSVRQSAARPPKTVSSYGFAKLNKTTERCTFCVRKSYNGWLSKWALAMPSVHMLGDRKVWLTLSSPLKEDCFPITDTFGFVQERSTLELDLRPFGLNSSLVIEFGSAAEAAAFEEELGVAVREMQRSKPGTSSFLQNVSSD